jgi:colanic acid/amylovoran biosynthesis protein
MWRAPHTSGVRGFLNYVLGADAVVVSGCGALADSFEAFALSILEVLSLAIRRGVPTVLLGQGVGPITSARLHRRVAAVLPHMDLIAVREGLSSPRFLDTLGVPASRVAVTGDDALELAYDARQPVIGDGLGLSLRTTPYAGLDVLMALRIASLIARRAQRRGITLVPLVSDPSDLDFEAIPTELRDGWKAARGQTIASVLEGPAALIRSVSRCRIVVTGTYHGAVFALGQGVPVVAVVATTYYRQKFLGLVHHFGEGCRIVDVTQRGWIEELEAVLTATWDYAGRLRPVLLDATRRQVEAGTSLVPTLQAILRGRGSANLREPAVLAIPHRRRI